MFGGYSRWMASLSVVNFGFERASIGLIDGNCKNIECVQIWRGRILAFQPLHNDYFGERKRGLFGVRRCSVVDVFAEARSSRLSLVSDFQLLKPFIDHFIGNRARKCSRSSKNLSNNLSTFDFSFTYQVRHSNFNNFKRVWMLADLDKRFVNKSMGIFVYNGNFCFLILSSIFVLQISSLFFLNTLSIGYIFYEAKFLDEFLLYHIHRKDIKHNFSPYFYPLYLMSDNPEMTRYLSLGAFLPQICSILIFAFK